MGKKRVIILGAGLAGLSAAFHLQRKGVDCLVLEKEPQPGGLCRSKKINGFTFDYDGHLLHFRHSYAFNLVKGLLGSNFSGHNRSSWIYSGNTYTRYPFQANLYGLPLPIVKECLLGLIETAKKGSYDKADKRNFLDWIYETFGKGIARHFMIPYNTKFWTVPPQQLNCAWLDGFIPVPSLSQTIEGTIKENQRQFGYNARFWYPKKGGIAELSLALASQIKHIHIDCPIKRIELKKRQIETNSGVKEKFDFLISTLPMPELSRIVKEIPDDLRLVFSKLRWNSVFNLNLGIGRKEDASRHWVYFPQQDICFFRVGFFHNFSPSLVPPGAGSLYVEASYSRTKPLDKNRIIQRIKEDLIRTGILGSKDKICAEDINDIKYGYPIYDSNYNYAREKICGFLLKNNIIPCGRYGSWRYLSMEGALLDGRQAAERVFDETAI